MSRDYRSEFEPPNPEGTQTRRFRRWQVRINTELVIGEAHVPCVACDISPAGAGVEPMTECGLVVGDHLTFELPDYGPIAAELRYNGDGYLGLMFRHDEDGERAVARFLVENEERRHAESNGETWPQTHLVAGGAERACGVVELSRRGARLKIGDSEGLCSGQQVSLHLFELGFTIATVQRAMDDVVDVIFVEALANLPQAGGGRDARIMMSAR